MRKNTVISGIVLASALAVSTATNAEAVSYTTEKKAYSYAMSQHGKPYVWGATGPRSYDCSGLVWKSYVKAGKKWSRHSADYMRKHQTNDITKRHRRIGDLIFFRYKGQRYYSHVGIYAGHGKMVDAQTGTYYGRGVVKEPVDHSWWSKHYVIDYRRVK